MIPGWTGKNQNKTPRHADAKEISGFEVDLARSRRARDFHVDAASNRVGLTEAAGMLLLLVSELFLDQLLKRVFDCRLIETSNDFVQETADDEALGDRDWNAAAAEVEEFVFVDLTGGGAVGATDVVGQNFEAGH